MQKLYNLDETELDELVDEMTSRAQPLYFYQYDDGNSVWVLWSDNEIDEDDVEHVFIDRIKDQGDEESDEFEFDD